jgi:hypothetical protein
VRQIGASLGETCRAPPSTTQGGCRPLCQAPAAGTIGATPAAPAAAPQAPGATQMAAGVATVLAKLDALIATISKESGFLEKVLS